MIATTSRPRVLQTIEGIRPIYLLPAEPFVEETLIPAFSASTHVDCMVGFFSSEALVSLAPGLASFINCSNGTFRLIVSPVLNTADWEAIEAGIKPVHDVVDDSYLQIYRLDLLIAAPTASNRDLPSLLGRYVLNRWRMDYDPAEGRLECTVRNADHTSDRL